MTGGVTAHRRFVAAALGAVLAASCATTPPPVVTAPAPPPATYEQKIAAILHLEDRRTLSDAALVPATASALPALLGDAEGRIRRRAALAIGRVGLVEGVAPLTDLLARDTEPDVRAMAAFALGLVGSPTAAPALIAALNDADARVQGRAAEGLGLIGHREAAGPISGMAAAHLRAGVLSGVEPEDDLLSANPAVEAVKLGVYALARLEALDALRAVVIGSDGLPSSDWWPFAYAVQRIAGPAAAPTLRTWLARGGPMTRAFAARGLARLKDAESRPALEAIVADDKQPAALRVQAIRALAAIGDRRSAAGLLPLVTKGATAALRLEATSAFGVLATPAAAEPLVDHLEDRWPFMRAAAQAALARADADTFLTVLSGLDVDPEWRVRAALATTLASLSKEAAALRLGQLARDTEPKVRAAALTSMAALAVPDAEKMLVGALAHEDAGVRMAAARGLGVLKAKGSLPSLLRALETSRADTTYIARAAVLTALADIDAAAAAPVLRTALSDSEWAIRVHAASLLAKLDPTGAPVRPAPAPVAPAVDATTPMIAPAYSPQAYVATTRGEIRLELFVLDAPRTVANFVALAGTGFFDGMAWHRIVPDFVVQTGDPRGDGEGGPGYTIRDELNSRPFIRGTVGMALDWKDTGGSQFFITHSPQPHLDARYAAFGQVVAGFDVVDRLEPGDRILSIRVWDGTRWIGAAR